MRIEEARYKLEDVEVRWGRAGEEAPNWGPWEPGEYLYATDHIFTVTPPGGDDWAEYTPDDYNQHYDVYLVEDYYLQIRDKDDTPTIMDSLKDAADTVEEMSVFTAAFGAAYVKHGDALVARQIAKDAVRDYNSVMEDEAQQQEDLEGSERDSETSLEEKYAKLLQR